MNSQFSALKQRSVIQNQSAPNINHLADVLACIFPRLDPEDQILMRKVYELLAEGEPVSHARLGEALDRPPESVSQTLDQWLGIFHDEAENIVSFLGLSVNETPHRLTANGKTSFAWCAWDTLFIPELLNTTVEITSPCARTGVDVSLTVSPSGILAVEPGGAVLSFLAPDERDVQQNITMNFCRYVHFFRSQEEGQAWVSENDSTFLITLADAFLLGRRMNAARYVDNVKV